jgi:hypothetical protein
LSDSTGSTPPESLTCLPPTLTTTHPSSSNSNNNSITVDSKDLLAAEQQLMVFRAEENHVAALGIEEAQEEAAWSLVSMGRGSSSNRASGSVPLRRSSNAFPEVASIQFLTPKARSFFRMFSKRFSHVLFFEYRYGSVWFRIQICYARVL